MRTFAKFIIILSSFYIGACSQVAVPKSGPLSESSLQTTRHLVPVSNLTPLPPPALDEETVVPRLPAVGSTMIYGFKVTPNLHGAMKNFADGDVDKALIALERATKTAPAKEHVYRWYLAAYRAHVLNLSGRAPEGESQAERSAVLERKVIGSDMMSWVLRGDARVRLGDYEQAEIDYFTVVKALGKWKFPTSYSGAPSNIAQLALTAEAKTRAYLGMSFVRTMEGDYKRARPWGEALEKHIYDILSVKAHPLYGSVIGELHPDLMLARAVNQTFLGAGRVFLSNNPTAGEPYFAAAQRFFDAIGFKQGKAYILTLKAKALNEAGLYDHGFKVATAATKEAKLRGLHDFVWRVQFIAGKTLLSQGRIKLAEKAFRQAQRSVDAITGVIGADQDKRRFGIGKDDITRHLAALTYDRGDAPVLFDDLERGRARAFVDLLATVHLPSNNEDADVQELTKITQQIQTLTLKRELSLADENTGNRDVLLDLINDRSKKVERLAQRDPQLAETMGVSPTTLKQVRHALAPNELLVYYLPAQDQQPVRTIEVTQNNVKLMAFNLTAEKLGQRLKAFMTAVRTFNVNHQRREADALSSALQVKRFNSYDAVYVVPSGNLHFIPWGALDVETPLSVLPTGSWLAQSAGNKGSLGSPVVVGDADYGGELPQLPGARAEAKAVATLLGVNPLLGKQATQSAVRAANGEGAKILHFATHAEFDADDPLESTLMLAAENGDMYLTAKDIFERPLRARLVILSACETGVGEAQAGDDFLGLPRSFYLSGASSVLSSLWPVQDEGTMIFMTVFYKRLKKDGNLGQAWLDARNEVRAKGLPAWIYGSFVLGGRQNWRS